MPQYVDAAGMKMANAAFAIDGYCYRLIQKLASSLSLNSLPMVEPDLVSTSSS
jgi:hypothetical protein